MFRLMLCAGLSAAPVAPAAAQIVAPLPTPAVDESAPPGAFLRAARQALVGGRAGEATEALERAESRLLIRSVRPSLAGRPSEQGLVGLVSQARAALDAGDPAGALRRIDAALLDPRIDEKEF
jgi:hypothetical protein